MTGFLSEVHEQPEAIHRAVDALPAELKAVAPLAEKLRRGEFSSVVFTGMGSSLSAAIPATILLAERGIPALALEASELLAAYRPLLGPKTLLVAASQSGESVETARLATELGGQVPLIGITNTPGSTLAKASSVHLQMHAGPEQTVSTKTYTCALAVLHLLALTLVGQPIQAACDAIHRTADQLRDLFPKFGEQIPELGSQISPVRFIEYLGRGPSRASAITGALITKETVKMPTEGMAGGQFRHGPWEVLESGITVCLFSGLKSARNLDLALAADVVARGAQAIVIGPESAPGVRHIMLPDLDPVLAPILEIVPVQLLAAELAAAKGYQPGEFRYSGKITRVE
ncbi:MAG TPA: SIS domain-containing protein [Aggregatilineales bacterium]|nr:SIS domain-containing protein [Aggregatilineales bacterium]